MFYFVLLTILFTFHASQAEENIDFELDAISRTFCCPSVQTKCRSACAGKSCSINCGGKCGRFNTQCGPYTCSSMTNACTTSSSSSGSNPDKSILETAGIVPDHLSQVPDQDLTVTWTQSGTLAGINTIIASDDMFSRPDVSFKADASALYTIMIVDNGIAALGGKQWFHWLKSNVLGSDLTGGDENYEYIAPFYFERNAANDAIVDTGDAKGHDILVLVYKQPGAINIVEGQSGCDPSIEGRVNDKVVLAEKYGLEGPVAGTFFWTKYNDGGNYYLCYFTKCTGADWPFPVPGVTDRPLCKA